MSDRNWLYSPPLGVGIAVLILLGIPSLQNWQENPDENQRTAAEQHHDSPQQVTKRSIAPIIATKPPPRNPKPKRDEWRSESDLEAQWKAADWNKYSAIATWIGLIVAGFGIYFVKRTLDANIAAVKAAEKSIEAAEKHLAASERPWVSVTPSIGSSLVFKEGSGRISVLCVLKNHGKSPALNVEVDMKLLPQWYLAYDELKRIRKKAIERSPRNILGHKIFPDEIFTFNSSMPIAKEDIENVFSGHNLDKIIKLVNLVVVGCAVYNSPTDKVNHITEFIAHIGGIDPKIRHIIRPFDSEEDREIPMDEIQIKLILDSGWAN